MTLTGLLETRTDMRYAAGLGGLRRHVYVLWVRTVGLALTSFAADAVVQARVAVDV
jgi:hypothetical protein